MDTGWVECGNNTVYRCPCTKAREAERKLKASGLADVIDQQTFGAFKTETPMQQKMKQTAEKYLAALLASKDSQRKPWLYLGGNPGCGKTHICTAVCGELLKNNIGVRYMQWLDEARRLKAYVNEPDFENEVEDYINVPVLYIDDLLKQKYVDNPVFTEVDSKIAFTILNARYLLNRPTIISTEWDLLDQLLPADEGVFSRVYERCKGFTLNIDRNPENNYRLRRGTA
jgi:DNA replication protein DnaC